MPLNLPGTSREVVQRSKTDVQRELPSSNPFLRNSAISALITACARRVFDFYVQLSEAIKQMTWSTATDDALDDWASVFGIVRNPATAGAGDVVATGTLASIIPLGTVLTSSDGLEYTVDATVAISNLALSITSLTSSVTTATAQTASAHGLADNVDTTISGATYSPYNGTFEISVVDETTFTYEMASSTTSPDTGSPSLSADIAVLALTSTAEGLANNQLPGTPLTFSAPIAGVDTIATVGYPGIDGAVDIESDADFRVRFFERTQNPVAHFNVADIVQQAKRVEGVTRVFVQGVTPAVGQVTIYFTRDNDTSLIPSAGEVTTVKNKILEIKPANTADADVIVAAPTGASQDFTFTALSPNTATMKAAVEASLDLFFREETVVGEDVDEDAYRSAIFNTIDTETGNRVTTFTLSTPSGDISRAAGEITTLGTVTFP